jgi:DnaA-like protein
MRYLACAAAAALDSIIDACESEGAAMPQYRVYERAGGGAPGSWQSDGCAGQLEMEREIPMAPHPVDEAMRIAAEHFGVSVADIQSRRRTADVHTARTWGMYLACVTTDASPEVIGERFGGRDHTIVSAVRRGRAREVRENGDSAALFKALKARCAFD